MTAYASPWCTTAAADGVGLKLPHPAVAPAIGDLPVLAAEDVALLDGAVAALELEVVGRQLSGDGFDGMAVSTRPTVAGGLREMLPAKPTLASAR